MTTVTFYKSQNIINAFQVSGHSGFANSGEDIVCSGISSAIGLTHCTLSDILKIKLITKVDKETANIHVSLPTFIDNELLEKSQIAINALKMHVSALMEDYPKNIKVLEVHTNAKN